jgi:N-hydroxyarylamine O-acetyltransferase
MERWETDQWRSQYSFTLQPRELSDFAEMCQYHQTSPESHFTRNSICSRATAEGRITVTQDKVIATRNGDREERVLSSNQEWRKALQENFGIAL